MSEHPQLLHSVVGGELKALDWLEFADLSAVDFVGAFPITKPHTTPGKARPSARSIMRACVISSSTRTACSIRARIIDLTKR